MTGRPGRKFRVHMKILVLIKRVVDFNVRIKVRNDHSGIDLDGAKMSINPFDEIAIEAALRLKEAGTASAVTVATIGPEEAQQQLRTALAMGADSAVLVRAAAAVQPLTVARVALALVRREAPGLVIMGKQSIDGDHNQTPQMLAALWDRPQATYASKIEIEGSTARVTREVDAGLETIEVDLPAVISTDLRLNEPRFVKLPEIMKAKSKPLTMLGLDELDVQPAGDLAIEHYTPPAPRQRGKMVASAAELVSELKHRGLL